MELSIVIVNYNVKYFLEQCLASVLAACQKQPGVEIFVVDNNSTDGSIEYLQPRFPMVNWVSNNENKGFGAANNQVLSLLKGRAVLFLNPDTIIGEDCLKQTVQFIQSTPGLGALGVRMIDGSGKYLKESKRGFPTPWVAFCKMAGFSSIFPKSGLFSGYYLGKLPENATNMVEALAGAFMVVTKEALAITGGFDERFFMYAEDIDLSYRVQQAGFSNYYHPEITIIHFKGESTSKDAVYIKRFYGAMGQFIRKHAKTGIQRFWALFLEMAVWIRAFLAIILQKSAKIEKGAALKSAYFVGDNTTSNEIEKRITKAAESAENVIFCQGPAFSFSDMIGKLQTETRPCFIHASGTGSVVGSQSSENRGLAISIE